MLIHVDMGKGNQRRVLGDKVEKIESGNVLLESDCFVDEDPVS